MEHVVNTRQLLSFILHFSMSPDFLEVASALLDSHEKVLLAFSALETYSFRILVE